jgi:O-antigen/teichoic acid export membrane protein
VTTSALSPTQPRLAVQAFWLTVSKFVAAIFNIALPMVLVRMLSQHEYGVYKQAFLFSATAVSLATFGVGVSAFYYMPRQPQRGGQIALNILLYNAFAGLLPLLVLIFYPQALNLIFRSGDLQQYAILLGVLVMLTLTGILVELMPTALQDVRNSTLFVVGTSLARSALILAAALIFRTVRSLIVASICSVALSSVILFRYLHQRFGRFWAQFDWHFFLEQLSYALPLGAYGVFYVIRKDLDNYFVSALYKPSEYAIYAIGWLEVPLISLFLESVMAVMVVRVSALQHEGRVEDIRRVMASAINRLAAVQFPIYAILLVAGRDLIVFFYTKTYAASWHIFAITITLIVLNVFLYDPVVRAYKHLRKFVLIVRIAVLATLFIVLTPIIRHFGMTGAAITAVLADLTERLLVGTKVWRTVEATSHDLRLFTDLLRVIGVTAVAAIVAYGVRLLSANQPLFVAIAAMGLSFVAVYVTGFYWFRLPGWETISKEHLSQMLQSTLTKLRGSAS